LIISTFNPLYSQEDDLELYIGREIDPEPQGKTINKIILVILPPLTIDIIPIEFVVDAGNSLHTTTKKSVILQEISIQEGDAFDNSTLNQNLVHLQSFRIIASAKAYALKTDKNDTIDLAIEIIDEWSLEFSGDIGNINYGTWTNWWIRLTEHNLLGLNKKLGLTFGGINPYYLTLAYSDYTLLSPIQLSTEFSINYDENFSYDYIDFSFFINNPLVKTLRKYSFGILYHFYYGIDVSGGYNFLYPSIHNNSLNTFLYQDDDNKKNIHKFHFTYSYLFDNKIDNVIKPELFLLFISDHIDNSEKLLSNDILINNQSKSHVLAQPYNYIGINLTTSKTKFIELNDYHVYNRTSIIEMGFKNTLSYKRADKILGSPYNTNIFREEIEFLYGYFDYLFFIKGNIFYEINISDYSEIINENIGFTQIFYIRPYNGIWGQIAGSFNIEANIRGNGERDVNYKLGNSYSSSDSLVRGTKDFYQGLGFINFNIEYRTKGIRINRSWSIGFAIFYDLGRIFQDYGLNPDTAFQFKHSIGISIRADYGTVNQIIIDFGFDLDGLPEYDDEKSFMDNLKNYFNIIFSFNQAYRF